MNVRRRATLASLALLAVSWAGLSLAQDAQPDRPVQEAPAGPPPPEPALQAPPPEEAPPAPPEPSRPAAPAVLANQAAEPDAPPPPPPPPPKRPKYAVAVLQALDKVTAQTLRFEARINEPVRYKDLVLTVHACETAASDEEAAETAAHLDVRYQPDVLPGRAPRTALQVYRGWMFANAPGLHAFEHPIYDVWVIACKAPSPAEPAPPLGESR